MKKVGLLRLAIVLTVAFGFVFCVIHCTTGIALSACDAPDTVIIAPKIFPKMRKAPSPLSHKKHVDTGIKCAECHHTWDEAKDKAPKKCESCHGLEKEGKKLSLKKAFHRNCQGCHKDLDKKGEKTGPTRKCNDCHIKK